MKPKLDNRAETLTEQMDREDCDPDKLFRTYHQFRLLNPLLSRWRTLFKTFIASIEVNRPLRILDIGCGGGDICLRMARWGASDGIDLDITGIDPDPRAEIYRNSLSIPASVTFLTATTDELISTGNTFDIVISNHLVHHLTQHELIELCQQAEQLAERRVVFNDIRRHPVAYRAFSILMPIFFRNSYIVEDGLTSIRRSFKARELESLIPDGWNVETLEPFRLLMIWNHPDGRNQHCS